GVSRGEAQGTLPLPASRAIAALLRLLELAPSRDDPSPGDERTADRRARSGGLTQEVSSRRFLLWDDPLISALSPCRESMRLPGLMSRWTRPRSWACCRPRAACWT